MWEGNGEFADFKWSYNDTNVQGSRDEKAGKWREGKEKRFAAYLLVNAKNNAAE